MRPPTCSCIATLFSSSFLLLLKISVIEGKNGGYCCTELSLLASWAKVGLDPSTTRRPPAPIEGNQQTTYVDTRNYLSTYGVGGRHVMMSTASLSIDPTWPNVGFCPCRAQIAGHGTDEHGSVFNGICWSCHKWPGLSLPTYTYIVSVYRYILPMHGYWYR
ncbi:hypothetical protein LZ31DRAFT_157763 [Colletotrichum somersetense]|nr:hypothetical protein LZ31DRAFT_157763 [Colletotrichum somersetense]